MGQIVLLSYTMKTNIFFCFFCFCVIMIGGKTDGKIGQFWHVTDVHLDNNYTVGGDPNRMCWSSGKSKKSSNHSEEFGDHNCDAPMKLIESAFRAMRDIFPEPDFIVWTGDDTAHVNDSFFSTDIVVGVVDQITQAIMKVFPDTLVLPVLGNHDLFPQNQAPVGPNILQTRVAQIWKPWLDHFNAVGDFTKDGRYVADIPNLKISFVAFNTLLWYQFNDITLNDPNATDPSEQFEWADQVIQDLADRGRKIFLMGHIPPGSFERYFDEREGFHWYQQRYNRQYIDMINKHGSRISAQLFGHHHTDSFRVFLNEDREPISYLLIAPAVSPLRSSLSETAGANNPGIRLITYDSETGEIKEVSQYYLDLDEANESGADVWKLEYNLTQILNLVDISASSLHKAALDLKADQTLFRTYYPVNTVQWENATACSAQCHMTQICSITEIDYDDYYECNGGWKNYFNPFVALAISTVIFFNILCL